MSVAKRFSPRSAHKLDWSQNRSRSRGLSGLPIFDTHTDGTDFIPCTACVGGINHIWPQYTAEWLLRVPVHLYMILWLSSYNGWQTICDHTFQILSNQLTRYQKRNPKMSVSEAVPIPGSSPLQKDANISEIVFHLLAWYITFWIDWRDQDGLFCPEIWDMIRSVWVISKEKSKTACFLCKAIDILLQDLQDAFLHTTLNQITSITGFFSRWYLPWAFL